MRIRVLIAVLCVATITASCRRSAERRSVTVVTTPDVAATGIVTTLTTSFAAQRQTKTDVVVTEERLIPALVQERVVDAVITSSATLRQALQRSGRAKLAATFGTEEFVIVGPRTDPARAKAATSPGDAFRRIARRDRAFCSPVDVPLLRAREALVWSTTRARPSDDRRYRECHGSAADVLRESSRRSAYTLTDLATFEAVGRDLKLETIRRGDELLVDRYMVILTADASRNRNALWFVQWVMSVRARAVIASHQFDEHRRLAVRGQR